MTAAVHTHPEAVQHLGRGLIDQGRHIQALANRQEQSDQRLSTAIEKLGLLDDYVRRMEVDVAALYDRVEGPIEVDKVIASLQERIQALTLVAVVTSASSVVAVTLALFQSLGW